MLTKISILKIVLHLLITLANKQLLHKIKQIDNAKHIDVIMPMYNLIEYSDNYTKTWGSLWH